MSRDFRRAFRLDRSSREDARASVSEELRHHIELATEELVEAGWSEEEARRETLRRFGALEETRAYCEQMQTQRGREARRRGIMSVDELRQDLTYAFRSIRRAPGYAGLVVLTLAFGIAANTTIFSVMNPYLFRPLPFGAPEELVQINVVNPVTGWHMDRFSYPQYEDWRARTTAFADLGGYVYGSANVTGADAAPEQIQLSRVTANLLEVLDARPTLGRGFRPEEGRPDAEPVVILGHGLWQRRYAADPEILGRTIALDGIGHTVIGVMPRDFNFPFGGVKLWTPIRETATVDRDRRAYQLVGRLEGGWTIERARPELEGILAELSTLHPDVDGRMSGITVKPLREALNFAWDMINSLFLVLLGAVGFVLLIACANVASLTLARASGRLREVSVRAAMGARRGRIVRQLLTESVVLALLAGALGVGLSYWVTGLLNPVMPEDLFKVGIIGIDGAVLAFSLAITLITPVAFGLAPAVSASRGDLVTGLKEGSKGSSGRGTSRERRVLVVAQVAVAVVLVTGAGLMLRSFRSVQSLDLGFDAERIATVEVILGDDAYPSGEERRELMRRSVAAVRRVPGVASASAARWLPLNHETFSIQVVPSSLAGAPADEWPLTTSNEVYPGYFETMSIELLSGRDFTTMDGVDAEGVVVVNRRLADRFWPGGDAVGQTLLMGDPDRPATGTVIGVVEEVHHRDLDPTHVGPQVYRPALQTSMRRFFLVAGTTGDPADVVPGLRDAMSEAAPNLPLLIRPMTAVVAESQLQWSIPSLFLGIFGAGALLLATLGIYGLVSYSVARRRKEVGVRIALGASASEIRRKVVGEGLRLTVVGLAIGVVVALGMGRLLSAVLHGVSGYDPATLTSVVALFAAVAAIASFVPAACASRTSPVEVLRSE